MRIGTYTYSPYKINKELKSTNEKWIEECRKERRNVCELPAKSKFLISVSMSRLLSHSSQALLFLRIQYVTLLSL